MTLIMTKMTTSSGGRGSRWQGLSDRIQDLSGSSESFLCVAAPILYSIYHQSESSILPSMQKSQTCIEIQLNWWRRCRGPHTVVPVQGFLNMYHLQKASPDAHFCGLLEDTPTIIICKIGKNITRKCLEWNVWWAHLRHWRPGSFHNLHGNLCAQFKWHRPCSHRLPCARTSHARTYEYCTVGLLHRWWRRQDGPTSPALTATFHTLLRHWISRHYNVASPWPIQEALSRTTPSVADFFCHEYTSARNVTFLGLLWHFYVMNFGKICYPNPKICENFTT